MIIPKFNSKFRSLGKGDSYMVPRSHKRFIDNSVKILKEDERIKGIAVGGSYIINEMDEYSDLDFIIAIEHKHYKEVMEERFEIAKKLGNVLSAFTGEHVGEPRLLICLYGPELLHVDLKFVSIDEITYRVENPIVLWERNNCISEALQLSVANFPKYSLQWIEDRFWVWIHYGATKVGRGEIFETIEFISFLRQTVIGPLLLLKNGKLPRGVRKIEIDAPDSIELLKETVASYNIESCIKSLNIIIQIYLDLREYFATDDFIKQVEAEKCSLEYLNRIHHETK